MKTDFSEVSDKPPPAGIRLPRDRDAVIDLLKGGGVALVVYGHAVKVPDEMRVIIYSFHMPLFFYAAGYVIGIGAIAQGFRQTCRRFVVPLMGYYVLFGLVGFCWWLLARGIGEDTDTASSWWRPITALLYGNGSLIPSLEPIVLWFFPCFILSMVFFAFFKRLSPCLHLVACFACLLMGVSFREYQLPWEAESAFMLVPFMSIGFAIGRVVFLRNSLIAPRAIWFAIPLFLGGVVLALVHGRVDFRSSSYHSVFLTYFVPLLLLPCIHVFVARFSGWLQGSVLGVLLTFLSRNSIIIFPTHTLVFAAILLVARRVGFGDFFTMRYAGGCVQAFLALVLLYPIMIIFNDFRKRGWFSFR